MRRNVIIISATGAELLDRRRLIELTRSARGEISISSIGRKTGEDRCRIARFEQRGEGRRITSDMYNDPASSTFSMRMRVVRPGGSAMGQRLKDPKLRAKALRVREADEAENTNWRCGSLTRCSWSASRRTRSSP